MSEEQKQKIVDSLMGVIEPGASWVVRGIANDVLVEPHDVTSGSTNRRFSSSLTTLLDGVNEKIANSGGMIPMLGFMAFVVLCIGVHLDWFKPWLGDNSVYVQSIWLYLAVSLVAFIASRYVADFFEYRMYQRYRDELVRQMEKEQLSISDVYVKIREDEDLFYVSRWLKTDELILSSDSQAGYSQFG